MMTMFNKKSVLFFVVAISSIAIICLIYSQSIQLNYYWWKAKRVLSKGGVVSKEFAQNINSPQMVDFVHGKLKSGNKTDRITAILLLRYLHDEKTVPVLMECFEGNTADMSDKIMMIDTLGDIGNQHVADFLKKELMKNNIELLHNHIVLALAMLNDKAAIIGLIEMLDKGKDYYKESIVINSCCWGREHLFEDAFKLLKKMINSQVRVEINCLHEDELNKIREWFKANESFIQWSEKQKEFVVDKN